MHIVVYKYADILILFMRVKKKDLVKFFDIADLYFVSFGNMNAEQYEFVDYFINKYELEKKIKKDS